MKHKVNKRKLKHTFIEMSSYAIIWLYVSLVILISLSAFIYINTGTISRLKNITVFILTMITIMALTMITFEIIEYLEKGKLPGGEQWLQTKY